MVHSHRAVARRSGSRVPIARIEIPCWADAALIAIRLERALGLSHVGVDIGLDEGRGLIVLEANARPGPAIRIANDSGLMKQVRATCTDCSKVPKLVDVVTVGGSSVRPGL